MIRIPSALMRLVGLVCIILAASSSFAQGTNLLTNPGFEAPFADAGGSPARQVAQGWSPWHVPATPEMTTNENVQPEYYPSSDTTNGLGVERIRSGADAQQYFSFFATHVGGVYQQVTGVTPGTDYTFNIYAYIWSSSFDDFGQSQGDGGVIVQAGIDPTGGTDGQSPSIIWSPPVANQYDTYDLYAVTATAAGSTITVFVRSSVSFPVKSNVIHLDDASLISGAVTPPTNTAVPPTNTFAPPTSVPPTAAVPPTNTVAPPTSEPATSAPPTNTLVPPTAPPTVPPTEVPPTPEVASPTPIPVTPTMTPTVDRTQYPGTIVYVVQRGDTVARIAQLYGSSVDGIISINGLSSNGFILVGQQLLVPVRLANPITATPLPPGFVTLTPTPFPTAAVTNAPPPTAAPPTPVPPTPPPTGIVEYVVRGGDSLGVIALRFNTTVRAISQLNGIVNPNLIYAGQRLRIPQGTPDPAPLPTAVTLPTVPPGTQPTPFPTSAPVQTYRVNYGDTLYVIALRFNVPLSRLIQVNGLLNPNFIFVGQLLVIPNN